MLARDSVTVAMEVSIRVGVCNNSPVETSCSENRLCCSIRQDQKMFVAAHLLPPEIPDQSPSF